jgi:phosphate starvation-inducible PhoH-like protein
MTKKKNRLPEEGQINLRNFSPINKKQEEFVDLIINKEVVIAAGVAGSGKTFVALATALDLLGGIYKKIILIKSVTTIPGEAIGFLPGSMEEKMDPFLMSYSWNIDKLLGKNATKSLMDKKIIEVLPIAYARGISIDDSIVIIDENQNIDTHTFKTLISRIGNNSKYIFLGDIEQIDRKNKKESCLEQVMGIFKDSNIVGTIWFTDGDCVRNPIIPEILQTLRKYNI